MRRFTNHLCDDWGEFVDIKSNAPQLFAKEFKKVRSGDSIVIGTVTDPWQPVERKWKVTRSILEFLADQKDRSFSLTVLTKSDLACRDLDLLKKIPNCNVGFSIALGTEKARRILEPRSSTLRQRYNALQKLHDAGISTFALIGPILPFITPLEEIMSNLDGKVDSVFGETLNTGCRNLSNILAGVAKIDQSLASAFLSAAKDPEYCSYLERIFREQAAVHRIEVDSFVKHH